MRACCEFCDAEPIPDFTMCPACLTAYNAPHDRRLSNGMIKDGLTGEMREPPTHIDEERSPWER